MSESLSDRLRDLQMKEADEVDPEAVARALSEKAGLAARMRNLMEGDQRPATAAPTTVEAGVPDAAEVPEPAQPAAPVAEEDVALQTFAQRLREVLAEGDEVYAPEPAAPDKKAMSWFLGRERQIKGSGVVTRIPELDEGWEEVRFYQVEAPFSFIRIEHQPSTGEHRYRAIEPVLTDSEHQIFEFVQQALIRGLNDDPGDMSQEARLDFLQGAVRQILLDYRIRINKTSQARVEYYIRRDFLGLGTIHVMMQDPEIEDISCDGPWEALFVYHRDYETIQTNVKFRDDADLDGYVIRLAQRSGKAISISEPILDAALPDGSRLQATLGQEVTENGSTFTIRRFKPDPFTPIDLIRFGSMSDHLLAWFWLIVEHGHSLIFSGGTASGKTTALNAISQFIPQSAKLVSIEDTREVNLPHKNWIKAVTRAGSTTEGSGEIGMFELLKAALRQRPEYILVGEVRGIEATVAFQAMATGHTVYSTMHADSARSVVYRLENEPINVPRLVLQALDVIAIQGQVRYEGKRVRRVKEVVELVGIDPSTRELLTNTVFTWNPANDEFDYTKRSYMLERIAESKNWSPERMDEEFARRQRILRHMLDTDVNSVAKITAFVKAYSRHAEIAMEAIGMEAHG